jgi:hypothetical protein
VKRTLHMLDELRDIVRESPGLRLPRSRAATLKARRCAVARRLQPPAQCLIDDLSKGPASALRFRLELSRDVVIEGQRRPHALML